MTRSISIRPLVTTDGDLVATATLDNLNWCGPRFTTDDLRERSDLRGYTRFVPARGDFGVVGEDPAGPHGVAWAQLRPADDPGYGFLDGSTPEISLWVRQDRRGQGVGRLLLRQLQQVATGRGLAGLSLSVEAGNDARRLYASEGFRQVPGRDEDGVMVWVASGTRPHLDQG